MNGIKIENPLVLLVVVVAIVGAIVLLQSGKAAPAVSATPAALVAPAVSKDGFSLAPELAGISGYLNAPENLTLQNLRGNVVLVDFWTYSCINCIRTLPYLKSWHDKYASQGLVIVGVHTPEFDFEKIKANVKDAVDREGILYPVVQDNDYATWNAFQNHYWPHEFLIDADGYIRHDHIGEGEYAETEAEIVKLLQEKDASVQMNVSAPFAPPVDLSQIQSPEIYFGYQFLRQPLGNDQTLSADTPINFSFPADKGFQANLAYLDGVWKLNRDSAELVSPNGHVALYYVADKVNIVAGADTPINLTAEINNVPLGTITAGADAVVIPTGYVVPVNDQKLYNLASSPGDYQPKLVVFNTTKGFRLYTFTFG